MQLCLSHLVDLALGRPELVNQEHFNMLHTLLHVVLKKLNLSDAPIEISDEHAEKAQGLLNELPKEPSICFKEFTFRNGVRVRKRPQNAKNQLTVKRSVMQVNKRWPNFNKHHCTSPVTPLNKGDDSKIIIEDLDALGQRVISLESSLFEMTRQFEVQNRINCCALQDLQKLKCSMKDLSDEFQDYKKSNDEECETESEEDFDYVEDVKWLKERMLEISESLKVQSECLKNIKCSEMPNLKAQLDENFESLTKSLDTLNQEHRRDMKILNASDGNKFNEIKPQLECLQHQISCIKCQLKDFEMKFMENQELTCDEICSLRLEVKDKIKQTASIQSSHASALINTQNISDESFQSEAKDQISQAVCISISQRLCHIQKQVMSQSICMQQLVRDLACKVDKTEFECYCRKIGDTIDDLLQLKHDLQAANNNAAGTCMPMSCISCQTSANMRITANPLKLPPLKYGRENIHNIICPQDEITCCNSNGDSQQTLLNSNFSCYSFKAGPRKAGGSHTKVNRCMQVKSMRFRRLKTPSCPPKRLQICKNEFKRNSNIF